MAGYKNYGYGDIESAIGQPADCARPSRAPTRGDGFGVKEKKKRQAWADCVVTILLQKRSAAEPVIGKRHVTWDQCFQA
jgi:hypothetical protein